MSLMFKYNIGDTVRHKSDEYMRSFLITGRTWEESPGDNIQRHYTIREVRPEISKEVFSVNEEELGLRSGEYHKEFSSPMMTGTKNHFQFNLGDAVAYRTWMCTISRDLGCLLVMQRRIEECPGGATRKYTVRLTTQPIGGAAPTYSQIILAPIVVSEIEIVPWEEYTKGMNERWRRIQALMSEGYDT